ncbi:MAG: aminopeptidase P family protein [Oscillospiraceae bacterium]|jgi:Xaa-Pro aminopeptidase|nr:aminopeptidase P family protein [Oscillospiraceae bacterium]
MVTERLAAVRRLMAEKGVDALIVPTADPHQSEYVGEYFKARAWLSGFTGSAGTLAVMADEAGLWTDGRYFIQAERQLAGSGVTLYRMGVEGVPTMEEFLLDKIPANGKLAFDGRVIAGKEGRSLAEKLAKKGVVLAVHEDLVGMAWKDRPAMSCTPAFLLEERYAGRSAKEKLAGIRKTMAEKQADTHLLTTLDDIAWLLNIRADDVACTPVLLSYALVTMDEAFLYVNPNAIGETVKTSLSEAGVTLRPYDAIYSEDFSGKRVLLDTAKVNFALLEKMGSAVLIDETNPEQLMKAVKNKTEIENLRHSHIRDGVAVTKFMYWLKQNVGKNTITECSAADYLESLRQEQEGFIEPSFHTISAYGPNAAMMHYSASPESDAQLKPTGLYLVDSGGQYYEGTTDITRTIALGPISDAERCHFTAVCRSVLALQNARFLYGCRGINLDILARGPIWELGIDYRCGTGHGVGYLSGVHEAPNGFRWKIVPERNDSAVLEAGMVTTDEPGVYIEGSHGIRTENELLCCKGEENEYGQFMYFETLTFAPIDLDALDPDAMTCREKGWLNSYHQQVFEKISPFLTPEEAEWLKQYTRPI